MVELTPVVLGYVLSAQKNAAGNLEAAWGTLSQAKTNQKAETGAADANVLTYTPPTTKGTYRIHVIADVGSATAGVISFTASYKDSNGNAVTNQPIPLFQIGTAAPNTTFTTSAVSNYSGILDINIDNSATNIVLKWVGGGTTAAIVSATLELLV